MRRACRAWTERLQRVRRRVGNSLSERGDSLRGRSVRTVIGTGTFESRTRFTAASWNKKRAFLRGMKRKEKTRDTRNTSHFRSSPREQRFLGRRRQWQSASFLLRSLHLLETRLLSRCSRNTSFPSRSFSRGKTTRRVESGRRSLHRPRDTSAKSQQRRAPVASTIRKRRRRRISRRIESFRHDLRRVTKARPRCLLIANGGNKRASAVRVCLL